MFTSYYYNLTIGTEFYGLPDVLAITPATPIIIIMIIVMTMFMVLSS